MITNITDRERELYAANDDLRVENANMKTVMMAAAVEIAEHWESHCDAEGYGPVNLLRRLENGYPSQYGYDAQTVVRMEARIAALEATNKELLEALKGLMHKDSGEPAFVKARAAIAHATKGDAK